MELMKPDEQIYRLTLSDLEEEAEKTIFIDDSEKNIETANQIGMHAFHCTNPNNLLTTLRDAGISF